MPDLTGFDANDHEPSGDFSPLPKADYIAAIKTSEWKDTKDEKGRYIEFKLEVLEGEFKGRNLWDRLNLKNNSEKAVKIANGTMSSICRAVGNMRPKKTEEFHDKPMLVSVDTEVYKEKVKNVVKAYKKVGSVAQSTPAPAPVAETGGSKPPWAK